MDRDDILEQLAHAVLTMAEIEHTHGGGAYAIHEYLRAKAKAYDYAAQWDSTNDHGRTRDTPN